VLLYIGVEVVGGLWTGSLALLADAGHMLSDAAALGITLFALRVARRPADAQRTFGYHRAEVLAAVLNGATLVVIALGILAEAWSRWSAPPQVAGQAMLVIATGGLLVNLASLAILAGGRHAGLNMRGAFLHVLSDALGSVGAMVAGAAVWLWGWKLADPVASAIIAVLVLRAAVQLLGEAAAVLMEAAPPGVDTERIRAAMLAQPGVDAVHDLHVWMITPGMVAMSGHVVTRQEDGPELLHRISHLLRQHFGIGHATIQIEPPGFEEGEMHP
jgi:cobalt-zinc-cadmium efflux system protein